MANSRVKPQKEAHIKSLAECDGVLFQIAQLRQLVKKEEAGRQMAINNYTEMTARRIAPMQDKIKIYGQWLKEYAEEHPETFEKKKTCAITFGSFGYRLSQKIKVKQTTLGLLKALKLDNYIRVKESPNIEEMHKLTDDDLARVDARRVKKDDFWYEINEQNVAEKQARSQKS